MIDNTKEYILCAAIWYKEAELHNFDNTLKYEMFRPSNIDIGYVFTGLRHGDCIYGYLALTGKENDEENRGGAIQGFLTSKNRFVERKEANIIAYNCGQIKQTISNAEKNSVLFSEDLY